METETAVKTNISPDKKQKVEDFLSPFRLQDETLRSVSSRLLKDIENGLENPENPVKMLPTFIKEIPNGTEKGDFLSLDVGGTNFRIMLVHIENQQFEVKKETSIEIPENKKKGSGVEFFNYIADCLGEFLDSRHLKEMPPLGFTFSFPCKQEAFDKGFLIQWTKDFSCSGVVEKDVVKLLKDAMGRRGKYTITDIALANDTVGTMMGQTSPCEIGVIIGTGTNACYMEEMRNVKRVEGDEGRMCINTEWGGFGDDGSLRDIQTEIDKAVDCYSSNPGKNIFEKMISGRYLGEVVRLVLVKMAMSKLLFKGATSKALLTPNSFGTKFMSFIERVCSCEHWVTSLAQWILTEELKLPASEEDCEIVRLVCEAISTRAAQLCGAALATIANRIHTNHKLDVGLDGSVYTKYPLFRDKLQKTANTLAECKINYKDTADSSGKGAAMVMAVIKRMSRDE